MRPSRRQQHSSAARQSQPQRAPQRPSALGPPGGAAHLDPRPALGQQLPQLALADHLELAWVGHLAVAPCLARPQQVPTLALPHACTPDLCQLRRRWRGRGGEQAAGGLLFTGRPSCWRRQAVVALLQSTNAVAGCGGVGDRQSCRLVGRLRRSPTLALHLRHGMGTRPAGWGGVGWGGRLAAGGINKTAPGRREADPRAGCPETILACFARGAPGLTV
jgi:hypothetical protein